MRARPYLTLTIVITTALGLNGTAIATTGGASATSQTTAVAPDVTAPTPPTATAPTVTAPTPAPSSGGQEFDTTNPATTPVVAGATAVLLPDGTAAAPALAPAQVQDAIWAANHIVGLPYVYGGGHRSFRSIAQGYDCSGAVSYLLHGGTLLSKPMDSSDLMRWGASGTGRWITVFTNPSHAYAEIAGLRLDTSAAGDRTNAKGTRWRPLRTSSKGYHKRHPVGL